MGARGTYTEWHQIVDSKLRCMCGACVQCSWEYQLMHKYTYQVAQKRRYALAQLQGCCLLTQRIFETSGSKRGVAPGELLSLLHPLIRIFLSYQELAVPQGL